MYIRKAIVAGQFYPSRKEELVKLIETCFKDSTFGPGDLPKIGNKKEVIGAVLPHAGYVYSGPAAASAVYDIVESYSSNLSLVIIGPNHTGLGSEIAIVKEGYFETPLGKVEVDKELAEFLLENYINLEEDLTAHENEHSIEVQLPFFQYFYGNNFKIVPIILRHTSFREEVSLELGYTLRDMIKEFEDKKNIVVIASSDFTHYGILYGYTPIFGSYQKVRKFVEERDMEVIEYIKKLDLMNFFKYIEEENLTICGYGPIGVLIGLAKALDYKITVELKKYYTSSDIAGISQNFVAYASIVFKRK